MIEVERRRQTRGRRWTLPWLLEGERAGPSEDVAELDGFWEGESDEERERRELLEWLGDYDPAWFDRRTVHHFSVLAQGWGALDG